MVNSSILVDSYSLLYSIILCDYFIRARMHVTVQLEIMTVQLEYNNLYAIRRLLAVRPLQLFKNDIHDV